MTDVHDIVAESAFAPTPTADGVGLEAEVFPIGPSGQRVQLGDPDGLGAVLDDLADSGRVIADHGAAPSWLAGSGRLTFEPGGQLEYSSGVHRGPRSAERDVAAVLGEIASAAAERGIRLLSAGHDAWTDPDGVAQQLRSDRYVAMDGYFRRRGGSGQRMMRHTCALQVNLDPGTGEVAERRWRLANLVAPLLVATFACSPAAPPDPAVSVRARTWRNLDPTRTGIPNGRSMDEPVDRVADLTAFALAADVLLLRCPDGAVVPGRRGFTLADWIQSGHPIAGWPTAEDVREHLTTLFTEVRPRGALEFRSIDALPPRWRIVPAVLLAGLFHGPNADHALHLLEPTADRLPDRLARAGEVGLKDPQFCAEAVEVWSYARAGAAELEPHAVGKQDLDVVDEFIDRFALRGLAPADELRGLLADDATAALDWAAEPLATMERV